MSLIAAAKERVTIFEAAAKLFPDWKPTRSCKCPWRDDHNPSFSVSPDGRLFNDFGRGAGGDVVDFVALAMGMSVADAARLVIDWAGVRRASEAASLPPRRQMQTAQAGHCNREQYQPRAIPEDVGQAWSEGCGFLDENEQASRKVAEWRGWPPALVHLLAGEGYHGACMYKGRRRYGWAVEAPGADRSRELLGVHLRFPPREDGARATWIFWPNAKSHGDGWRVPSFPVVWGDISTARLIVCAEGQFDAASFGWAAGWFASESSWPSEVALVGIRGAQGIRPFLDGYRDIWPPVARALLVCDADEAGKTWFERGSQTKSFADKLAERCTRVQVLRPSGAGVKDANDALRAGTLTADAIRQTMLHLGIVDAGGHIR